jgi:D-alanine-D-alanine ligase
MKIYAIIMGGYSKQYEISLLSGSVVYNALDKTKAVLVHILKEKWVYVDEKAVSIDKNDFSVTVADNKINFDCV